MADDIHKNEDPEEERDDQFDDDDDFGLPDLDYDELDDEDDLDIDEPFDDEEIEIEEEPVASSEPEEVELSSELDDDTGGLDLSPSGEDDWEKELEKELEQELNAEDGEDVPSFYEEESFDEFEATTEEEISPSVFGSDDAYDDSGNQFDEMASPPVGDDFSGPTYRATGNTAVESPSNAGEGKGKFVRTVVIGTLLFAAIALVLYVLYSGPDPEETKKVVEKTSVKKEAPAKKTPAKKDPVKKAPAKKKEIKETPVKKKEPAPKKIKPAVKPAGEITKLSASTGKAYVVVGSFFDSDIANDFAKKLSSQGKSPMIIPPFKDHRYYRVAIAEYDTFADAQSNIGEYRSEYGSDVWTLRY